MQKMTLIIWFAVALYSPGFVSAAIWYVSGGAPAGGDGTSWERAFRAIQDGIDASSDGDTVIVGQGTYVENVQLNGKNIVLRSTDPSEPGIVQSTIIDGNRADSVVSFLGTEKASCVLAGFTIQNGKADYGGGIRGGTQETQTLATIRNNIIVRNRADEG